MIAEQWKEVPIMRQYPTLICSLPRLPSSFEQRRAPISRPRLESRLKMLTDDDRKTVKALEQFWRWESIPEDQPYLNLYHDALARCSSSGLRECVETLADIRMLTVSLRARMAGKQLNSFIGRWGTEIRRNWNIPDFGLGRRFPWIGEVETSLRNRQYHQTERIVSQVVWREMTGIADSYYFNLPTVVSFLIRWDLINRWASRDQEKALSGFKTLVEEAIGDYAERID